MKRPCNPNWWSLIFPCVSPASPYLKFSDQLYARYRAAATDVSLSGNKISVRPFDFEMSGSALSPVTFTGTTQLLLNAANANGHTEQLLPLSATASHFQPLGFVGRVAPAFSADPKTLLAGVEVAIDQVDYNPSTGNPAAGRIKVRARVAEHRPPGTLAPTLVRRSYDLVYLRFVGSSELAGAWDDPANSGLADNAAPHVEQADANGFVTFTVETAVPVHLGGLIVPRVWVNGTDAGEMESFPDVTPAIPNVPAFVPASTTPVLRGRAARASFQVNSESWEETRDAWAQASLRVGRHYKGSATAPFGVEITTQPDVANEKSGKRARLMFTRWLVESGSPALTVNFTLPASGSGIVRSGTYGTSGTADYYFSSAAVATALQPQGFTVNAAAETGTVTFKPGQDRMVLEIIARPDDALERETAYVRLAAGTGYTPAGRTQAEVLLYDGPTWSLIELTSLVWDSYQGTYVQPSATKAWTINHEANARVGGWLQLPPYYGYPYGVTTLGHWTWPGTTTPTQHGLNFQASDRWHGFSTSPLRLAGQVNQRAAFYVVLSGGLSYLGVPSRFTTTGSAAYGISANATYIVGKAVPSAAGSLARPMRWQNESPADLVAGSPNFSSGEARGVDNSGLIVGWVDSGSLKRAFRNSSGTIVNADMLKPYVECISGNCDYSAQTWNSWAYAVVPKVAGSSDYANYTVGAARWLKWSNGAWVNHRNEMAVLWVAGDDQARKIGLLNNDSDAASRALAINDTGEIVGWSGTSEWSGTGVITSAAFVSRGVSSSGAQGPVSLNDKHFVHGMTGWNLAVAYGINNQGWIVGIGTKDGLSRGFLLRKLSQP